MANTGGILNRANHVGTQAIETIDGLDEALNELNPQNNLTAEQPPAANNDSTEGYSPLSIWIYDGVTYRCVDSTPGAAVWIETGISAEDLGSAAFASTSDFDPAGAAQAVQDALTDQLNGKVSTGEVGSEEVTTSTDTQTVAEALDSRLPVINAALYLDSNRIPGVTDDLPALKNLVADIPSGGARVIFPNGIYYTPRADVTDINNWLVVPKSNVVFESENKHGATLLNFIILTRGSYGDKFRIDAELQRGSRTVTTTLSNTFELNDYVQLISAISPYSTDAGDWQNGSVNPTNLTRPDAVFTEISRVSLVNSPTSFEMYNEVIYPMYRPDTTGQSVTIPGIEGAYARKLNMIENVVFDGLVINKEEGSSFRGIDFQRTANCGFRNCAFLTNDGDPGRHYRAEESLGFFVENCVEFRSPLTPTGSSWNSGIIGGGCQDLRYSNNRTYGGSQTLDITAGTDPNLLFGETPDLGPAGMYMSAQVFIVDGNFNYAAGRSFTTHPGTYFLTYKGNKSLNGNNALLIRSRFNEISGNTLYAKRTCLEMSAFHDDSNIEGNHFYQIPDPSDGSWVGVLAIPLSSEVMNNNDTKRVIIETNTFYAEAGTDIPVFAFQARHSGNGVPSNPSFTEFTDEVKARTSEYVLKNNEFVNCSSFVNRFINGVEHSRNTFRGSIAVDHWIETESGGTNLNKVWKNMFINPTAVSVKINSPAGFAYPDGLANYVSNNESIGLTTVDVANHVDTQMPDASRVIQNGVTVENNGQVRAVRSSGAATLEITAIPRDGTSTSRINVLQSTGSSGGKSQYFYCDTRTEIVRPMADNVHILGASFLRWSEVFAGTGTINTSDEREKEQQRQANEAEKRVAASLKSGGQFYKWISAVDKKGDRRARWHYGWMAQKVVDAFESEGLDAHDYGMLCYDEWEELQEIKDEKGGVIQEYRAAGNRFGLRMDQLLAFIVCNT